MRLKASSDRSISTDVCNLANTYPTKISASTRSGMRKFGCNILAVVQQYDIIKDSPASGIAPELIRNQWWSGYTELPKPIHIERLKKLITRV